MATVLIVEDDVNLARTLSVIIITAGHRCISAKCISEAMVAIQQEKIPVAIIDGDLGQENGCELIEQIRTMGLEMYVIGMSGVFPEEDFLEVGADCFFLKPFEVPHLIEKINSVCK